MIDINKKYLKYIDILFICLIFGLGLKYSVSYGLDNKIIHDFPHGYYASDGFCHTSWADVVMETGSYRHIPKYYTKGMENVVPEYPPGFPILTGVMSFATGFEDYDLLFLLICGFGISVIAVMNFLIIRKHNRTLAYLSTLLFPLMFYGLFMTSILFNQFGTLLGNLFLIFFFWMMVDFEKYKYFLPLVMAATCIAHLPEFVFEVLFLGLFFLIELYSRKDKLRLIKNLALVFIISLILISQYLFVFSSYYVTGQRVTPSKMIYTNMWGDNTIYVTSVPILIWIIIGLGLLLYLFFVKKKNSFIYLYALFILIITFGNYFYLVERAMKERFFWPIYLGIFFALPIYYLFKFVSKKIRNIIVPIFTVLTLLILFNFMVTPYKDSGVMTKDHWDSFKWLRSNTDVDQEVLFFWSDYYTQDCQLTLVKRPSYRINLDSFINGFSGDNKTSTFSFRSYYYRVYEESIFAYGLHDIGHGEIVNLNICDYEYYVFDKTASSNKDVSMLNIELINTLASHEWIKPVYVNDQTVILMNTKPGEKCV